MGRTPFELGAESKEFMTDEEMEDYYEFTTQGRWIGSWEMSNGVSMVFCYSVFALCLTFISTEDVEDLLRRMIHPNQVLRIRAVKALEHVSLEDEEADSRSEFPSGQGPLRLGDRSSLSCTPGSISFFSSLLREVFRAHRPAQDWRRRRPGSSPPTLPDAPPECLYNFQASQAPQ